MVCPAISAKEADGGEGARRRPPSRSSAPQLAAGPWRASGSGSVHGKQPAAERDDAMAAFAEGRLDVLVATTVIEVGVDVPNASVMVVVDADRFGLSQLHQLRGRIGRGEHPGLCLLLAAVGENLDAETRLQALVATTDGFELAELDLTAAPRGRRPRRRPVRRGHP